MNEHTDLNVSYMPLFEDRSEDGEIPLSDLFCLYNIIFTVKIFYVKVC